MGNHPGRIQITAFYATSACKTKTCKTFPAFAIIRRRSGAKPVLRHSFATPIKTQLQITGRTADKTAPTYH